MREIDIVNHTGASNALFSVVSSYKMHPKAQISLFVLYGLPSHNSGDIYDGVPTTCIGTEKFIIRNMLIPK